MSDRYEDTHWGVRLAIAVLFVMNVVQTALINRNSGHAQANACMLSDLVRSERGGAAHFQPIPEPPNE